MYALRCLIFKAHITIKWSNTLPSSVICHDDAQSLLLDVLKTHSAL